MQVLQKVKFTLRIVVISNPQVPKNKAAHGCLIPNFITQALQNKPLTIYGDGNKTRSICYVSDLVEGLLLALFRPYTTGEVFNLGNIEEHTVLEYAQTIIRLCNASSTIIF